MVENSFVFVSPMHNASKTLPKMLHSLAGQSYDRWKVILIDDVSDHTEFEACRAIVTDFRVMSDAQRFTLVQNTRKLWETQNVLNALSLCEPDDIVCRLDPDDYLCDLDALWHVNDAYSQRNCDCLWTMHCWFDDKRHTNFNISGPLSENLEPHVAPWVTSHLKTFRRSLLDGVPLMNFQNEQGELVRRAGDQALYLPVLKRAKNRVFLPRVTYAYRCDMSPQTFQTDDAKFQAAEAMFLRRRGYVSDGQSWESAVCLDKCRFV